MFETRNMLAKIIPGLIGLVAGAAFVLWFQIGSKTELDDEIFRARVPGTDYKEGQGRGGPVVPAVNPANPTAAAVKTDTWPIKLEKGDAQPSKLRGFWPHFRGEKRDAIVSDPGFKVATKWGKNGPPKLWTREVGEGYAGAIVRDGRMYLYDYDTKKKRDVLRCMSLETGKDIWASSYPIVIKRSHGISRTVPALSGKFVVGIGPKCHTVCLDAETGELKWKIDMVAEYGAKVPTWYTGQCPLIDDGRVILAPGGANCMMLAVELETGKVVWKAPNPTGWKMTHTSVLPYTFAGKDMYIYSASRGVVGVAKEDGKVLFTFDEWKMKIAAVASPVPVGDGKIFFSGGYGVGSMMVQMVEEGGKIALKKLFRLKPKVFGSAQHTPLFYKGHIYGVRPDQQLVCMDLDGKILWSSTSTHKYGIGPYMLIDGKILVMDDHGKLTMVDATTKGFNLLAEAKVLDGHDSWAPMAMAGKLLILRDLTVMTCLDLQEK